MTLEEVKLVLANPKCYTYSEDELHKSALENIQMLEKINADMTNRLEITRNRNFTLVAKEVLFDNLLEQAEKYKRERDAAVEQLKELDCATCKHSNMMHIASVCCKCTDASNWEWQGVKEAKDENT